jgi:hypothetical protein
VGADGRTSIVIQEQNMNTQKFIESGSADPYIAELYRRAVKVLNAPGLNRQQREQQIRRIQNNLREHQEAVASTAHRHAGKKNSRAADAGNNEQGLNNRCLGLAVQIRVKPDAKANAVPTPPQPTLPSIAVDQRRPQRSRPILKLRAR